MSPFDPTPDIGPMGLGAVGGRSASVAHHGLIIWSRLMRRRTQFTCEQQDNETFFEPISA